MSLSNLGGIGGTYFTPIVNWPEVAILGVSRGGTEPVWKDGQFVPRQMLPLVAVVRPPRDRWRRRHPLPPLGRGSDRATLPSFSHRLMAQTTQIAVLGAGPGGYAAAFYAADLGMQVTLIDEEKNPGGVCLYRGCIPSKALLHVAKVVDEAAHASKWGVTYSAPAIDVDKLRAYKQGVVDKLTAGVGSVAKLRKVNYVQGRATLTGPKSLKVAGASGDDRDPVRAPDSRHRLASDEDSVAGARQPAHDGLDLGARAARRAEVAAGGRRRLHRPRARHRLRHARQQGVGGRDDGGPAARRRPRPGAAAREAAQDAVRVDHAQHQGREGGGGEGRHPRHLRRRRRRRRSSCSTACWWPSAAGPTRRCPGSRRRA